MNWCETSIIATFPGQLWQIATVNGPFTLALDGAQKGTFALGDAGSTPNSKTGAAIRKQAPVVVENVLAQLAGRPLTGSYNGYASCPIVTSGHDMLLAEFDYDFNVTPTFPGLNPVTPHRAYWYLKRYGLPFMYWNLMLKGLGSPEVIVLPDTAEIVIEIVAGRDTSVSFDMHALASLLHGDRIAVRRSRDQVRFLHPKGWTYFDTLRQKLHWNEGVA